MHDLYSTTGTLSPAPPFDFEKSLEFLGLFGPMQGEQTAAPDSLTKALSVNRRPIVFQLTSTGETENPRLGYTLFSDQPIDALVQRTAADRIAFFLSLADNLRPFYAIGRDDPVFAPVVERLYGYHQVKFLTPFECACWAILTQRNAMPIARQMKQALVERFGGSLELNGVRYETFPEPICLAADPSDLQNLIRNGRRAEYLGDVARAFSEVDEAWLRAAPYEDVEAWLHGIKGIGAWSAAFVMLRGLGRMERIPITEGKIPEDVSKLYGNGQMLSVAAIQRIAAPYGAWQGYWAHYVRVAA
jgi:DNA-3-methyladenine glycosylase II